MKQALPGILLVILLIAAFSTLIYAVVSGAVWQFALWFVASDIAVSVFLGTLITIALLLFLVSRQGVRR